MKLRFAVLASVVVLAGAPACSGGGEDDDAFRLEVDGRARIGDEVVDDGGHGVAAGDTVTMLDGEAVLELPGDRSVLLRAGVGGRDDTVLDVAPRPVLVAGDAVVIAGNDDAGFEAGDVEIDVRGGAARVQRGLSVTVAMYEGDAEVRAAGRAFAGGLHALRQVSVPATGVLPREAVPLVYDEDAPDPWDERFIGDAIDLGDRLDARSRGFTGQVGPRVTVDVDLLRRVLPDLGAERGLDEVDGIGRLSPGESLVGAAIVVESGRGSFTDRWSSVFDFRADGAQWGLVALDQAVQRDALLDRLNDAFGRSPLLFAVSPRPGGGTTTTTSAPPGGGGTTTTQPGGSTSTTTTTEPDEPPIVTIPPIPPITAPPTTVPDQPQGEPEPDDPDDSSGDVARIVDAILDTVVDVVP